MSLNFIKFFKDVQTSTDTLTLLVLSLTLMFLIWSTIETHRMASQSVESSLRPIILRSGQINMWQVRSLEEIKETFEPTLEFVNLKNIATEITGYIIVDYKKYPLVFYSDVIGSRLHDGGTTKVIFNLKWSWLPEKSSIVASYNPTDFVETQENNQIHLEYQDIEGNKYYTHEDEKFTVTSAKK